MVDTMDVVIPRRTRRAHSEAFKQSVISACSDPGVTVAGVSSQCGAGPSSAVERVAMACDARDYQAMLR
jgi:transposase-like protein